MLAIIKTSWSVRIKKIVIMFSLAAIFFSGFFVGYIAPAKAWAQIPGSISIEGVVVDEMTQNSISGVKVSFVYRDSIEMYIWCNEDTGVCVNYCTEPSYQEGNFCYTVAQEIITDANGYYIFEDLSFCDLNPLRNWWGDLEFSADNYNKKVIVNIDEACGQIVTQNIQLTPKEPDPVILIPGILGSWQREVCEINPLTNLFGCKLKYVPDPILNTYDSLWQALINAGYQKNVDLFAFGYNWRLDNNVTAGFLKQKIAEVKQITGKSKVDLVVHSMGGLVARAYIQSFDYADDVDQLIFLGTPQLGSPEAYEKYEALLSGYTDVINYVREKVVAVGQLLPSYDYLKKKEGENWIFRTYPTENYVQNTFLENLNLAENVSLLKQRVRLTNIVSDYKTNGTITAIRTVADPDTTDNKWLHGYPENYDNTATDQGLEYGTGDGTVPMISADGLPDVTKVLCEGGPLHSAMPTECQRHVIQALTGKWPAEFFRANIVQKMLLIYVHSPVKFQVVDQNGQVTGTNFTNSNGLEGIPESLFDQENGFVFIKNPINGEYKINVLGIDGGGIYGLSVDTVDNSGGQQSLAHGTIIAGEIQNYKINYDNTLSAPVVIEAVKTKISIDDMINDVKNVAAQNGFKQKNLDKILITQLNLAKRWEGRLAAATKDWQKKIYQHLILTDIRVAENLLKVWFKTKKIDQVSYDILIKDFNLYIQQYK